MTGLALLRRLWPRALSVLGLLLALAGAAQADRDAAWRQWTQGQVRAVNVLPTMALDDLPQLKRDWGINALRVQVILQDEPLRAVTAEGLAGLPRFDARLRALLDAAESQGIGVVLDLHRPEGSAGMSGTIWKGTEAQDQLVRLWQRLANELRGHPALIGYDILNEPTPPEDLRQPFEKIRGTLQDWNLLAARLVAAIRAIDPDIPLIVETTDWAKPFRFRQMARIDDPRIVYSFHMYHPVELTLQGVNQFPKDPALRYPGVVKGKPIDREELVANMRAARQFADRHQVPIFVGEFGVNKYADEDSRQRYVADLLDIFAAERWSWAYHAFKIWDGWMPTDAMRQELKRRSSP